ncbi:hypothetical protein [Pectinatus haikarae]|uniref:hypothetical protein n=1 Tax=Pectinatus haikarae TaxID=349096 RepID=UPI0018C8087C|nr:hypothetical protein [Pectinatus haikarae]
MRMTAKEFALKNNMPLATVKRYCKKGLFRCHRIGRKYSIDVSCALKALADLDEQQAALSKPMNPVPRRQSRRINTPDDYLKALDDLKRGIA